MKVKIVLLICGWLIYAVVLSIASIALFNVTGWLAQTITVILSFFVTFAIVVDLAEKTIFKELRSK